MESLVFVDDDHHTDIPKKRQHEYNPVGQAEDNHHVDGLFYETVVCIVHRKIPFGQRNVCIVVF